jgi:hypothetical protein
MDAIRDSGKVSADDFKKIQEARSEGYKQIAMQGSLAGASVAVAQNEAFKQKQREKLFQQSAQDAGQLPADIYKNAEMRPYLTTNALQQRVRNGLSQADKQEIENNIKQYINSPEGQKDRKKWQQWTRNTTEGANFDFGDDGSSNPSPTPPPASNPSAPRNPFNRFGDSGEAQRWADWEAQNNPNNRT